MKKSIGMPVAVLTAVAVGGAAVLALPEIADTASARGNDDLGTSVPTLNSNAGVVGPLLAATHHSAAIAATPPVGVNTGPSEWRGGKLRHPQGGGFADGVARWANIVVAVMDEHKIPRKYLPGILAQIDQESDGDPNLVNDYDSNAAAGTPSKGLLQIIGPTYQSHAKTGYESLKYQTVPYTNLWASLRYVIKRYGMEKFEEWNSGSNSAY